MERDIIELRGPWAMAWGRSGVCWVAVTEAEWHGLGNAKQAWRLAPEEKACGQAVEMQELMQRVP